MPRRLESLTHWLKNITGEGEIEVTPASTDASFRRYFRIDRPASIDSDYGDSLIVMDAPPDKEDTGPFIKVSRLLSDVGVHAPQVIEADTQQGYLLLTDLGSQSYLDMLNEQTVDGLYGDALNTLLIMQRDISPDSNSIPAYDKKLLNQEMELFREWYLRRHCNLLLSAQQQDHIDFTFALLTQSAISQPQVFVHRDYHSRNLMATANNNPGVLDFQDAVIGPVTYDLVSLLRDCYIEWPRERVEQWALEYLHRAADEGVFELKTEYTDEILLQWFDWMGVQRHLKASGIFTRLFLRDHKPGYLNDIPRTLNYVRDVCSRYEELNSLHTLLEMVDD